jgi:hypothetical protein
VAPSTLRIGSTRMTVGNEAQAAPGYVARMVIVHGE